MLILKVHAPLKRCPFCGMGASHGRANISIEKGLDVQCEFVTGCFNEECKIQPKVKIKGEKGFRDPTDLSNEEAKRLSIEYWNKRDDHTSSQV